MNALAAAEQIVTEFLAHHWQWRLVRSCLEPPSETLCPNYCLTDIALATRHLEYTLQGRKARTDPCAMAYLFDSYAACPISVTLHEEASFLAEAIDDLRRERRPHRHSCLWELKGTLVVAVATASDLRLIRPVFFHHLLPRQRWERVLLAADQVADQVSYALAVA